MSLLLGFLIGVLIGGAGAAIFYAVRYIVHINKSSLSEVINGLRPELKKEGKLDALGQHIQCFITSHDGQLTQIDLSTGEKKIAEITIHHQSTSSDIYSGMRLYNV